MKKGKKKKKWCKAITNSGPESTNINTEINIILDTPEVVAGVRKAGGREGGRLEWN